VLRLDDDADALAGLARHDLLAELAGVDAAGHPVNDLGAERPDVVVLLDEGGAAADADATQLEVVLAVLDQAGDPRVARRLTTFWEEA